MKRIPRRPFPARLRAPLAVFAVALAILGGAPHRVGATPEGSITYTVSQSPSAGSVLQVGQSLTFTVDVTDAPNAFTGPVVFDFKKPASTSYQSFGQQSGNIITGCTDNTPGAGFVRCTVGNGASQPAGALSTGTSQEIVLSLTLDAAAAGGTYSDATVQALFADAGAGFRNAGDIPDNVQSGDGLDGSVGGFTVTNILGANANISIATDASPNALFEGGTTTLTVAFSHGLAAFGAAIQPIDIVVTNADLQSGTLTCPAGSGSANIFGSTARCTGSSVPSGSTMSVVVRARDTAAGDDIVATVVAPSLGLPQSEAQSSPSGTAVITVPVDEIGLETIGGSGSWSVGQFVSVCTAAVAADAVDDHAAGSAQSAASVGTSTLVPVSPLAPGDFTVVGPSGAVGFAYLDPGTCGPGQSGAGFTVASAGSYSITAGYNGDVTSGSTQLATRGTNTLSVSAQTTNPVPTTSSLSPTTATAGGTTFVLTVNGSGFVPSSTVRWNGSDRTTSFLSANQLTATITSSDIAAAATATVSVWNPAPGGGLSNVQTFTITGAPNGAPQLSTVAPSAAAAGSPAFTITVYGTGFVNGSVVRWNGNPRTTTFFSSTQLLADIGAADVATPGSANVTVFNPAPGGGTSLAAVFSITNAANPVPSGSSVAPVNTAAGGAGFTLTVNGANFVASSVVRWNGADRATTYISATQLTAAIPAGDIVTAGTANVTVYTPAPGGGTSPAMAFAINNPAPSVSNMTPTTVNSGSGALTLTVNGSGFVAASKVQWNGSDRATNFVSSTRLTASISAADVASAGTASVVVTTPPPIGGASSALTFTIASPPPGTPVLSPQAAIAGVPGFSLTVTGSNFTPSSVVRWDGVDLVTAYASATQLIADVPAANVTTAGTFNVLVFTPAPGGGASPAATFTVNNPEPSASTLTPANTPAAGAAFTLIVAGTDFVAGSVVRWNGTDRATTFVNSTQLTATITAADIATQGTATVTVFNGAPGGGTSAGLSFTIGSPQVTISSQLVVTTDSTALQPRSRLTFSATKGTLTGVTAVSFVIKRSSDNKYWNSAAGQWQDGPFENGATDTDGDGTWTYTVPGAGRRQFVLTNVVVEVRAVANALPFAGTLTPTIQVR